MKQFYIFRTKQHNGARTVCGTEFTPALYQVIGKYEYAKLIQRLKAGGSHKFNHATR